MINSIIKVLLTTLLIVAIGNVKADSVLSDSEINKLVLTLESNDFRPQAEINWRTALFAAYASRAAYDETELTFDRFSTMFGYSRVKDVDISDFFSYGVNVDLQGYIYKRERNIDGENVLHYIIVFRGTELGVDWITDLNVFDVNPFDDVVRVGIHKGFLASMKLFDEAANQDTKYVKSLNSPKTIFSIFGHSLGGSIAELYAAKLVEYGIKKKQISVYTIGQAAVGNKNYKKRYRDKFYHHRLYHENDPILWTSTQGVLRYLDNGISVNKERVSDNGGHSSLNYVKNIALYKPYFGIGYTWNGNASIINNSGKEFIIDTQGNSRNIAGITYDVSTRDKSLAGRSFNSFQWQVNSEKGNYLRISSSPKSTSKVTICYSRWNGKKEDGTSLEGAKYCYNDVTLPYDLDPTKDGYIVKSGRWFVVGVKSQRNDVNTLQAQPVIILEHTSGSYYHDKATTLIDAEHFWTGTGSIINYSSNGKKGYGLSYDIAHIRPTPTFSGPTIKGIKSVVFFQWQVNAVEGKNLEFTSNCASQVTISSGEWFDRKVDGVINNISLPNTLKLPEARSGDWIVFKVKVNEVKNSCTSDDNGFWIKAKVVNK